VARFNVNHYPQLNQPATMPRQLPWLNNGGGSRTQVKQQPKARPKSIPSDVDDDFFDGTVLASSSKGKGNAVLDEDSNDDFPDLSAGASRTRTTSRTQGEHRNKRALSSSPPALADHEQPQVEDMRKGVSKFDLRDDEWMMVEDEFLETAKLFTRHLHIAEYEKLKERIEAKKYEQVQGARPVVADGKMSTEGAIKKKAEVQEKRQRKALLDVFASQEDENDQDAQPSTPVTKPNPYSPTLLERPPAHDPDDEDDLDFVKPLFKRPLRPTIPTPAPSFASASRPPNTPSSGSKSASPSSPTPHFAKPALPVPKSRATTSRKSRATPFDMLDDYVPRANRPVAVPAVKAQTSSSPDKPPGVQTNSASSTKPTPVLKNSSSPIEPRVKEEWGSGLSKETAERIAKRKAEREKEKDGKKKKNVGLDDIPTFLV
jgi:hypothetical protein